MEKKKNQCKKYKMIAEAKKESSSSSNSTNSQNNIQKNLIKKPFQIAQSSKLFETPIAILPPQFLLVRSSILSS